MPFSRRRWCSANGYITSLRVGITTWPIGATPLILFWFCSLRSCRRIRPCLRRVSCMQTEDWLLPSLLLGTRWYSTTSITWAAWLSTSVLCSSPTISDGSPFPQRPSYHLMKGDSSLWMMNSTLQSFSLFQSDCMLYILVWCFSSILFWPRNEFNRETMRRCSSTSNDRRAGTRYSTNLETSSHHLSSWAVRCSCSAFPTS